MADLPHVRRILFLRTDRLGETLLNLPAIAALRQALPHASLTLAAHPELEPLMSSMPGIDRVLPYPPAPAAPWWLRARRFGRFLRRQRFDLAVVSNPKKELHLAVWLAGIPMRVGYARKWGWLLTHRLPDAKALGERHEVEYNLDLIRAVGIPVSVVRPEVPHFASEQVEVLQLIHQQGVKISEPFVVVHPWTSNPIKRWPLDRYRSLMQGIVERLHMNVVVVGGREERQRVADVLPELPVADLVGRLTLTQLAALLQRARAMISNDSGPMHLAAALGTPTIALFGTEDAAAGPRRWGPWGEGHVVIWRPSMEAIRVDDVIEALTARLAPAQ
jgi:lipopolysaccharide heptosyltransferase II